MSAPNNPSNQQPDSAHSNASRRFDIDGKNLGYPTLFHDGCSGMGLFLVNAKRANQIIADSGFKVAEIFPGKAVCNIVCVHYTDSECGVYEEIALNFMVQPFHGKGGVLSTWSNLRSGNIASYTWRLPVSSVLARDAGIFMWGFPKTIEDLSYQQNNQQATFSWHDADKLVLRYTLKASGSRQPEELSPPVYSIYEGAPHISFLTQQYKNVGYHFRGGELELGEHPIADELRSLGLGPKPLFAVWNGGFNFSMSHPEKLV